MTLQRRESLKGQLFWQKTRDIVAVGLEFTHHAARYEAKFRTCRQEYGLNIRYGCIGVGKIPFILKVFDFTESSDNEMCPMSSCEIDCQTRIGFHFHSAFAGKHFLDRPYSFSCDFAIARLIDIEPYADDETIEYHQRAIRNILMSDGERVERTWKYSYSHASSSMIRLSMMKFWRSMVFLPI